ncbi:MAG: hypothetical protein ACR2MX_14665, partial [Cyclobacteriaceae bacterium]
MNKHKEPSAVSLANPVRSLRMNKLLKKEKMRSIKYFIVTGLLGLALLGTAQENVIVPGLSDGDSDVWMLHNREHHVEKGVVHLNAQPGDGLLWLTDVSFSDGEIELDIEGKDERGRSFVGLAFHGENDSIFDAIY